MLGDVWRAAALRRSHPSPGYHSSIWEVDGGGGRGGGREEPSGQVSNHHHINWS